MTKSESFISGASIIVTLESTNSLLPNRKASVDFLSSIRPAVYSRVVLFIGYVLSSVAFFQSNLLMASDESYES
jgi:hypothetical protein